MQTFKHSCQKQNVNDIDHHTKYYEYVIHYEIFLRNQAIDSSISIVSISRMYSITKSIIADKHTSETEDQYKV